MSCSGCGSLTGFDLDAWAAALERAAGPVQRRQFLEAVERGGAPGLVARLEPLLQAEEAAVP